MESIYHCKGDKGSVVLLKVFNYIFISMIFLDTISQNIVLLSGNTFDFRFGYLLLIVSMIILLLSYKNFYIHKGFMLILFLVSVLSLIGIYSGNNTFFLFFKQIIGILVFGTSFYLLIKINDYKVKELFKIYINLSIVVSCIGLLQFFYNVLVHGTTNLMLIRISATFSEPSSYAYVLMPALFISIASLFNINHNYISKHNSILVVTAMILTFSAIAYVGIILSLLLLIYNTRRFREFVACVVLGTLLLFFLYSFVNPFTIRVDDTWDVITGKQRVTNTNLSTFTLVSNFWVAYRSFQEHPIIGTGLGSHVNNYNRYIHEFIPVNETYLLLNREDANSLLARVTSELGLVGLSIMAYLIFGNYLHKKRDVYGNLWIVNNAVVIMFFLKLLRSGHYFIHGLFFFIWLYYYSSKNNSLLACNNTDESINIQLNYKDKAVGGNLY